MAQRDNTLTSAMHHLRSGRPKQAAGLCVQVLKQEPDSPEAHYLLGLARRELREPEAAARALVRTLELSADHLDARMALAGLLLDTGNPEAAAAQYFELLNRDPRRLEAHYHLGIALQQMGRVPDAVTCYETALLLQPDFPEAHNNLGSLLQAQGRLEEAASHYTLALKLRPGMRSAALNLSRLHLQAGRTADAVAAIEALPRNDPERAPMLFRTHVEAGRRALEGRDAAAAEAGFRAALAVHRDADAYGLLGAALLHQGRPDEAAGAFEQAVALAPRSPAAQGNLGYVRRAQGRLPEAIAALNRAIALDPDFADAHNNLSLALLGAGDLTQGFAEYEWRFKTKLHRQRPFGQPIWNGEPLAGKRLLIHAEQGLGDELLFASCIPDLLRLGGELTIECDARLVPLFARSFPGTTVVGRVTYESARSIEQLPPFDFQLPMGSLIRMVRSTPADFSRNRGYLVADPARVARWRERLCADGPGVQVGLSWRSSLSKGIGRMAYPALSFWRPLLDEQRLRFINLQYDGIEEFVEAVRGCGGRGEHFPELNLFSDMEELAALLSALDLVIAVPNSVAALAGALGCAVLRIGSPPVERDALRLGQRHGYPWYPDTVCIPWEVPAWQLALGVDLLLSANPVGSRVGRWAPEPSPQHRVLIAAVRLLLEGDEQAAAAALEGVPDGEEVAIARAWIAFRRGDLPAVSALLDRLPATASPRALLLLVSGHYLASGEPDRLRQFCELLERVPGQDTTDMRLACIQGALKRRQYQDALLLSRAVLDRSPELPAALSTFATALLGLGRLQEGFAVVRRVPLATPPGIPRWQGEPLDGRRLLVTGFGTDLDLLFATVLAEMPAGQVTLTVAPEYVGLLARGYPGVAVRALGENIDADLAIPLMHLVAMARDALERFPSQPHLLQAEPARVEGWHKRLGGRRRPRVGVALGPNLEAFATALLPQALKRAPGTLVDMDGTCAKLALKAVPATAEGAEELAALIAELDAVVAVRGVPQMLAAVMGKPVYWLDDESSPPPAVFLLGTETCPWFPAMLPVTADPRGFALLADRLARLA